MCTYIYKSDIHTYVCLRIYLRCTYVCIHKSSSYLYYVYIQMYTCIYISDAHTYVYICVYIRCTHVCIHKYINQKCIRMYTYEYISEVHTYVYISIYIRCTLRCTYMYINKIHCMYIHHIVCTSNKQIKHRYICMHTRL